MNSELTTMAYSEAMSQSRPTFFQIRKNSGMVFVTKDGDTCYLTDSRYLEATERELIEKGFTLAANTLGSTEGLNGLIRRHGVKRLAIEDLHMTIGEYEDLRRTLPVELIHAGMAIDKLRAYLTPEDRDALGHAQSLAEKALAETLEVFRIGMTEKELEAELVYRMYLNGADDLSFKPEIISGANASMPHGNPSDKPIDYYAIGVNGRELDAVARDYIEASGLEGIYQPGKLGCRIEDILWLGENNEKVNLTHFPKDELIVLGK